MIYNLPSQWIWLCILLMFIYGSGYYIYTIIFPYGKGNENTTTYKNTGLVFIYTSILFALIIHYKEHYIKNDLQ